MKRKGLTITYIVKVFPLNYDEGYGNVSVAKKVHRGSGETYLFTSRQALRFSIVNWLVDNGKWKYAQLSTAQKVIQYELEELKKEFPEEADLFGYMVTTKKEKALTRPAVAKLTHLISLEPWFGDQELLTNKNFADRVGTNPDMANIETGYGYYKYTLSIDLDKVGVDENLKKDLPKDEKIKRVCDLIEATKFLYRDIRGRREDLKPMFVIGGVYHIKSPFFHSVTNIEFKGSKPHINIEALQQILEKEYEIESGGGSEKEKIKIGDLTHIGILKGEFVTEIKEAKSPFDTLDKIKEEVKEVFNE